MTSGMKFLSFDLRALALMRICVAAVIIIDLSIRISDLEAFYSDNGAVPLSMVFRYTWNRYFFSIHNISGLWQVQFCLFMASLFCAIMLLIGFRTKLFTFLSWLMMLSLHNRNVFILQGGDDVLRMVLFWAMFIPWGYRYSYDRIRILREKTFEDIESLRTITSLATFAYVLQLVYLYAGSALLKGAEWNSDFTAVYYAYSLDQIAYPHTKLIYYYPELLKVLTAIAYYFELFVPLLFFIPVKHGFFRLVAVILICGFHSFNLASLFIGIFPLVGISTSLGILPSFAMDRFDHLTAKLKRHIEESFSGIAYAVRYLLKWKPSFYAKGWLHDKITTFVLVFLMVFIADWNISNLHFITSKIPERLHPLAYVLRLDQCWGMFAPGVLKDDGWYVFEGICKDGTCKNLLSDNRQAPDFFRKPNAVVSMFKNDRWRKYSENYIFTYHDFMRPYFCNYYKREWNKLNKEDPITRLKIYYVTELTQPDYKAAVPQKSLLCDCE